VIKSLAGADPEFGKVEGQKKRERSRLGEGSSNTTF